MSLIVISAEVATTVPSALPVLTLTVKISAPSDVESSVGVTLNDPVLPEIVKLPIDVLKSPAFELIVQYNVVKSGTLTVLTLNVNATPSLT